jgi:hypothetical protein
MQEPGSRNWIVVASADHVRKGGAGGFMQAGHGKAAPLRRVQPGDRIACYSPATVFGGKDRLQAFTAFGVARDGEPYQVDMGGDFRPFRRDVALARIADMPIQKLLERLEFTSASAIGATSSASGCSPSAITTWTLSPPQSPAATTISAPRTA